MRILLILQLLFLGMTNSQIVSKINKLEEYKLKEIIPANIYIYNNQYLVSNRYNKTVDLLDNKFNYVETIANKGNGPGEIKGNIIFISEYKDKIVIVDAMSNRIQFYDKKGDFIEKMSFESKDMFIEDVLTKDDKLILVTYGKLWIIKDKKINSIHLKKLTMDSIMDIHLKKICLTEDNKIVLFWNDHYKICVFDMSGNLLYEIKNEKFKNYPYEENEINNVEMKKIMNSDNVKSYPSIAENIFVKNNYLYIVLKARAKNKFKQQVDVYDLRTKKFVKKLEGDEFKLFKSFCFNGDEIIAIADKKTNDNYENIIVKAKLIF